MLLSVRIMNKPDGSRYVQCQSVWWDVCVDMLPTDNVYRACRRWLDNRKDMATGCSSPYGCVAEVAYQARSISDV
jgi:hypothetical protein